MMLVHKRGLMEDTVYTAFYRDGDEIAAMVWELMQACVAERGVGL